MHRIRIFLAALCLIAPTLGLCSVSGLYIAHYSDGVAMLQIIETPDHHITGNLRMVAVKKEGELVRTSYTIVGAVDGQNISMELQSGSPITAVATGNSIRVVGLGESASVFQRGNLAEFERQAAALQTVSKVALDHRAEQDQRAKLVSAEQDKRAKLMTDVNDATASMARLLANSDKLTQTLASTQTRLRKITKQMAEYLAKARSLAGNTDSRAGFARAGYIQKVGEGTYTTASLQFEFQGLRREFDEKQTSTFNRTTVLEEACKQVSGASACNKFSEILPAYRARYAAMEQSLNGWSAVYQQEKLEQDRIDKEANALQ
jgi:hypothetical protein